MVYYYTNTLEGRPMRSIKSVVVALLLTLACSGRAMTGQYICDRDRTPKDTLDLRGDGTFLLHEDGTTLTGTWSETAGLVEFDIQGGRKGRLRVDGKDLVDSGEEGGRWTRQ
jgi:hypothetical protein